MRPFHNTAGNNNNIYEICIVPASNIPIQGRGIRLKTHFPILKLGLWSIRAVGRGEPNIFFTLLKIRQWPDIFPLESFPQLITSDLHSNVQVQIRAFVYLF